ncbi:hypothetical protein ACFOD9_12805 [Novosphingobium bradum]|uniref:DUF4124 domain-containing protein n=1 Tax=Novosphingobium bradum TaxID=1737444 RepID=A0ABV7IT69_9SPHN
MRATALLAAAPLALLAGLANPAQAQDLTAPGGERVNTIIIYGDDACPAGKGDEITVCARKPEAERYRIPAPLREPQSTRSEAWNEKVLAYETVGRTGIASCSPVGPGGSLGCTQKLIDRAYAERKQQSDVGFARMIQDERARRAGTFDPEAAATQARVEQAEKDYEARERARQDAATPPPAGTGDPTVPATRP